MADNRYRPRSPPGSRYYPDPRASTGMVFSSSFDPAYPPQPRTTYPQARHSSIYETQPINRRTYQDDVHGPTMLRTEYAVRPRNNSFIPSETRRPASTVVKSTSPVRARPVEYREDSSRYLVPASSGRQHHQRHYSATRADIERLNERRPRPEYHQPGGYSKPYHTNRPSIPEEDYSYTGPREQFERDYQTKPREQRRPISVIEVPEQKPRKEFPQSARPERRSGFDSDSDRPVERRSSLRQPVLHHYRDEGYSSARDDYDRNKSKREDDDRPKRREDELRPRRRDENERPRRRDDDERLVRKEEDVRPKRLEEDPRSKRLEEDLRSKRLEEDLRLRRIEEEIRSKRLEDDLRSKRREDDRDVPREFDRPRRQEPKIRSRESSPDRSGLVKGAAAVGLGGLAAAGLAKRRDDSDSERKERRHRKHRHKDKDEDVSPMNQERRPSTVEDDRYRDQSEPSDSEKRKHRRRKHRNRSEKEEERSSIEEEEPKRRPQSRPRELDPEQRTLSPGEDEDGRPRRVHLVEPGREREETRPRGILKAPRTQPFPEDPNPTREGVAPLKDATKDGVPPGARWTKISRVLVNPEALEKAHERFEERDDYVIVLRVISREEIEKLAEKTREIREQREKEWQEQLESRKKPEKKPENRAEEESDDEVDRPLPALDSKPAVPGEDPRVFSRAEPNPVPPLQHVPIPDITLQRVESLNYSENV